MKIRTIYNLMYEEAESQMVCLQDAMENVMYIGTFADLERNHPKSLDRQINTMFTERYPAYNNVSGLTIVI